MAIIEVSVVPIGTKTPSVSKHVSRVVKFLENQSKIKYNVTAMGTIIEGDLDRVLEVAQKMHEVAFTDDVKRVITTIRIDDRKDKPLTMGGKLGSLMREMGKE